jgi:Glycosyl hydrolase family 99
MVAAAFVAGGANSRTHMWFMPEENGAGEVAIFYYPWYGTEARDGSWQHWQQHGNHPPKMLASQWMPVRGAYSSSDPVVVRSQMREIAEIGVQTVIVSWWGPGSAEDARLPAVSRAAREAGLQVALHVEPYAGRTPSQLEPEIRSLVEVGIRDFYLYDSTTTPDSDWRALNRRLSGVRLFANTNLPGKALAGGFAGLYTYDVFSNDGTSFPRMCGSARRLGLFCAPSVGPGYDAVRATGDPRVRSRERGETYDRMWRGAVRASASIVTITSYNEWHEGTQIEAARAVGSPYSSYDGAYGLVGLPAQRAYLDRTAMWVGEYRAHMGRVSTGPTQVAAGRRT